jgi:hypothetical protein
MLMSHNGGVDHHVFAFVTVQDRGVERVARMEEGTKLSCAIGRCNASVSRW